MDAGLRPQGGASQRPPPTRPPHRAWSTTALEAAGLSGRMLLQVHDELVLECPLAELAAGQPVSVPVSRPYGCAVKYAV